MPSFFFKGNYRFNIQYKKWLTLESFEFLVDNSNMIVLARIPVYPNPLPRPQSTDLRPLGIDLRRNPRLDLPGQDPRRGPTPQSPLGRTNLTYRSISKLFCNSFHLTNETVINLVT